MYASISFKRVSALTNASAVTVKPGGGGPFIFLLPPIVPSLYFFVWKKRRGRNKEEKGSMEMLCIFLSPESESREKTPDRIEVRNKVRFDKLSLR